MHEKSSSHGVLTGLVCRFPYLAHVNHVKDPASSPGFFCFYALFTVY